MSKRESTVFGIYPVKEALAAEIIFDKVYVQK
ncbi:MAG: 23S rRNA (guanosine2251-2'-O)-methyltransferase, partial [Patiriisocius sp.]